MGDITVRYGDMNESGGETMAVLIKRCPLTDAVCACPSMRDSLQLKKPANVFKMRLRTGFQSDASSKWKYIELTISQCAVHVPYHWIVDNSKLNDRNGYVPTKDRRGDTGRSFLLCHDMLTGRAMGCSLKKHLSIPLVRPEVMDDLTGGKSLKQQLPCLRSCVDCQRRDGRKGED